MARSTPSPRRPTSRRHRGYRWLLAIGLGLLLSFALPGAWAKLPSLGYLALATAMLQTLAPQGRAPGQGWRAGPSHLLLYRTLGLAAMASGVLWYVTPVGMQGTGIPVLVLWSVFSGWSALRLVLTLAQEQRVNGAVLQGALAGYVIIGLTGGLIFSALETIQPGSFHFDPRGIALGLAENAGAMQPEQLVWDLNFVRHNYYAFVSLTTTGYGDVIPLTPMAQIGSVALAIAGTFYLAVVMGLLISRFSQASPRRDDRHDAP